MRIPCYHVVLALVSVVKNTFCGFIDNVNHSRAQTFLTMSTWAWENADPCSSSSREERILTCSSMPEPLRESPRRRDSRILWKRGRDDVTVNAWLAACLFLSQWNCTQQGVQPLGAPGGRVQLGVNGRQQPLPLLHHADAEGVKEIHIDWGDVSSTKFCVWEQISKKKKFKKSNN